MGEETSLRYLTLVVLLCEFECNLLSEFFLLHFGDVDRLFPRKMKRFVTIWRNGNRQHERYVLYDRFFAKIKLLFLLNVFH